MLQILKKIFISLVAIAMVCGTLFLDEKMSIAANKPSIPEIEIMEKGEGAVFEQVSGVYKIKSTADKGLSFVLFQNSVVRLAKDSEAQFTISQKDVLPREFNLTLKKGQFWINTINSSLVSKINGALVKISTEPGVFAFKYDGTELSAKSVRHTLEVEIAGNKLVVPEGRELSVSEEKVKTSFETISKLRYSKLAKEFPFYEIDKSDEWIAQNLKTDDEFLKKYKEKVNGDIRTEGPRLGLDEGSLFFKLDSIVKQANVFLTFDGTKKTNREVDDSIAYFDSALYAFLVGNEDVGSERLLRFKEIALDFESSQAWQQALKSRYDKIAFAMPEDSFYEARHVLFEVQKPSAVIALEDSFNEILDIASLGADAEGRSKTLVALRKFGSFVQANINKVKGEGAAADVFFEFVKLNDFLSRRPDLIREEFLKISQLYESENLKLIASKEEADDQRQFFISEKLKRINVIKDMLEKDTIDLQEGRAVVLFVASQIDALKPAFSGTAVTSYFDEQLSALAPFISFLRSSTAENLHGSFKDNFEQFQSSANEVKEVTQLLSNSSGGEKISPIRREELAAIVSADFADMDISDLRIVLPETADDGRVRIVSALFEDRQFTAIYDTQKKILTDIVLGGEQITNAVRIANLRQFFLVKMGKLSLPSGVSADSLVEQPSQQSALEKVAKSTLIVELSKVGITLEDKYVGFEDYAEDIIHVRLATLGTGSDAIVFAFDVSQKLSVVSNLKVNTVSGEIPVNDEFALQELPVKVAQVFKQALFEKQKEDELKKILSEPVK
ncbi:MAG: hypothetical protein WCT53_03535 [Candidatus Gracilibacteria bacterium]